MITWLLLLCFAQNALTLDELIDQALANNGDLKAYQHRREAALEEASVLSILPDPTVMLGVALQPVETRVGPQRGNLQMAQSMPWPGQLSAKSAVALSKADIHNKDGLTRAAGLRRDLSLNWYELYFLQRKRAVEKESLQLVIQMESVARARFRTSQSSFAFVVQAQSQLAELTEQIAGTKDDIDALLARIAGIAAMDKLPQVGEIDLGKKPVRAAAHDQPLLAGLEARAEMARRTQAVSQFLLKPNFTFGLNYIYTDSALNPAMPDSGKDPLIATVALNIPLYRKRVRAQIGVDRALEKATYDQYSQARRQVNAGILEHKTLMRKARRRTDLYDQTLIPQARDAMSATLQAFRTGELEFTSVIAAQQSLLRAQLGKERAHADSFIHSAQLDWLGKHQSPHPSEPSP